MKLDLGIDGMISQLEKLEKEQDEVLSSSREIIRFCSKGIKALHAGEIEEGRKNVAEAEKRLAMFKGSSFVHILNQSYQEVCEAKLLLAVIEGEKIPTHTELGLPFEMYLTGLCDLVGELRREMLEMLKSGKKKEASYYFDMMNAIYEELVPLRFSNSLLPNFRKKQDVARMQVEQARSELVRSLS